MGNEIQVYIVHGYTASPEANWFPWLKKQLTEKDVHVTVFNMPNSNMPDVREWDEWLDQNIRQCDENTYFIGHSLGCITCLRYLNRKICLNKIGGIIMVSGFMDPVATMPELDAFVDLKIDVNSIIKLTDHRCAISSPSDTIVAYEHTCNLAKKLEAELITIKNGGHFLDREGFVTFPAVYNEICRMINCRIVEN